MWGLMRAVPDAACPVEPLPGLDCLGQDPIGSSPATPTARNGAHDRDDPRLHAAAAARARL